VLFLSKFFLHGPGIFLNFFSQIYIFGEIISLSVPAHELKLSG